MDLPRGVTRTARAFGLTVVTLALSVALVSSGAVSLAACAHAHHASTDHSCPACIAAHPPGVANAPPAIDAGRRVPMERVLPLPAPGTLGAVRREPASPRGPPRLRSITNPQLG